MEIEAKVKLKDYSHLRKRLRSAGGLYQGRVFERNWLFDHPERLLARADKLLRLREQENRVFLTYKGPREKSKYKKREELEMEFPSSRAGRALLEAVGFVKWFYYEKFRETWRLGACEVVLDELPLLGLFAEIEAPTDRDVEEAVKRLKLTRDYIASTYVELLNEHSKGADERKLEFSFPAEHKPILAE